MLFKDNLKIIIDKNKDKKIELIEKLGLTNDRTIRNYINGTREPNIEQIKIIKHVLKCSYEDLLE